MVRVLRGVVPTAWGAGIAIVVVTPVARKAGSSNGAALCAPPSLFSELSGIETLQIMKYAARVIELMDELGLPSPRARFLEMLAEAQSNIGEYGSGADLYLRFVESAVEIAPSYS